MNKLEKGLFTAFLAAVVLICVAAGTSFSVFNTNQFVTDGKSSVSIKSNPAISNLSGSSISGGKFGSVDGGNITGINLAANGISPPSPSVPNFSSGSSSGVVTVTIVMTNTPPGGPNFVTNIVSGTVSWPWFSVPIGTNITLGGFQPVQGSNTYVFVKRNIIVNNDTGHSGTLPVLLFGGNTNHTFNGPGATAGVSYLFNINGTNFYFGLKGNQAGFRFIVDGVDDGNNYVSLLSGAVGWYNVVFKTGGGWHQVEMEMNNNPLMEGIVINPTNGFAPYNPPNPMTSMMIIGDSRTEENIPDYSDTNGNAGVGLGYATWLGRYMPAMSFWSLGIGGTGYVSTNSSSATSNFLERATCDYLNLGTNAPPYILFSGGVGNDVGAGFTTNQIGTNALFAFGLIHSNYPNTRIFATAQGNGAPDNANLTILNANLQISNALAAYGMGSNFIDEFTGIGGPWITGTWNVPGSGNATVYVISPGTHPTPAGHQYLAQRLAYELAIRGVPTTAIVPTVSTNYLVPNVTGTIGGFTVDSSSVTSTNNAGSGASFSLSINLGNGNWAISGQNSTLIKQVGGNLLLAAAGPISGTPPFGPFALNGTFASTLTNYVTITSTGITNSTGRDIWVPLTATAATYVLWNSAVPYFTNTAYSGTIEHRIVNNGKIIVSSGTIAGAGQ